MRKIGINFKNEIISFCQRPFKTMNVCGAQAKLAGSAQQLYSRGLGGDCGDQVAGAVGRVVVDDEDGVLEPRALQLRQHSANERLDVLGLVVGREDEPGSGQGGA